MRGGVKAGFFCVVRECKDAEDTQRRGGNGTIPTTKNSITRHKKKPSCVSQNGFVFFLNLFSYQT